MKKKIKKIKANKTGLPWSYDELIVLHSLSEAGKTYPEIAEVLTKSVGKRDYNADSIRKKFNDTNWDVFFKESELKQELMSDNFEQETEKQKIIDSTLSNQEKQVKKESARTSLIIDALKSAIYRLPKPKPTELMYKLKSRSEYTPEHVGVILSDLHVGAAYTMEDTGGLSEYNLDIFKQKMEKLKASVIEISERHRHMYDLPHLHIFCLGDIVAGMPGVGEWSPAYISLDVYDQMVEGISSLRNTLACWSKVFPKITFYGISGNHGKCAPRGAIKVSTNWDRITYNFLQISLKEYNNINWVTPTTWWIQEKIQGHNFYLTHGDGIKSSQGIPYYGVERAERNIIGLMKERPDYMLVGHFHNAAELSTNSSRIIINGSFCGADMYSLKDLTKGSKSEQKMFGIHEKKGITWTYNIHLDSED